MSEILLIVAPSLRHARTYANKHHLPLSVYRFVSHAESFYGLPRGQKVLWLTGDQRGEFPISEFMQPVIEALKECFLTRQIDLRSVRMEDAP